MTWRKNRLRVKMGRLADPPLPDLNSSCDFLPPQGDGKEDKQTKTQVPLKASVRVEGLNL